MLVANSYKAQTLKLSLLTTVFTSLLSACGGGDNSTGDQNTASENKLPVVTISAVNEITAGAEVRLEGTASDPDGTIASYQWSQKSGYGVTIRDKSQANASFTAPVLNDDTILEFELVVTDDKGAKATDSFSITVTAALQPQTALASCNVTLANSVLETYQQTMNFESKIALKKWLCSAPETQDTTLAQNVAEIFSVELHSGSLAKWKSAHCSDDDSNFSGSKSAHVLLHNASESAANSWSQCMQSSNDLVCYAKQNDRTSANNVNSVVVKVAVKADDGLLNTDIVATNLTAVESVPSTLTAGTTDLQYQLDDRNNEAYFEVSGNANNNNVSCDYTLPQTAKIAADACGVFRQQALAKGKLSERDYNYLTETDQVPLFSASDGELVGYYSCALYSE